MPSREKVCPVVYRDVGGVQELLAFHHPSAGRQFVKGTIEAGESPSAGALRELHEESGLEPVAELSYLGQASIGSPPVTWHFYALTVEHLPQAWDHQTEDDFGHVFSFFWHPLALDLDHHWHPIFHEALRTIRQAPLHLDRTRRGGCQASRLPTQPPIGT